MAKTTEKKEKISKKEKKSEPKTAWESYSEAEMKKVFAFAEDYKKFISTCKTERECVETILKEIKKAGYVELSSKKSLKAGDKVYAVNMGKNIAMFNIGTKPFEEGMNILWAHIDSPRLDAKQNPFYESGNFAYMDTHYYGGIKKYQWVTIPLAIHGVVVKKDGTKICLSVGEKEDDPVFFISDLLPHLGKDQMEKNAKKVIEGEQLDVILGNIPLKDTEKDAVLENIFKYLSDSYSLSKEDFISGEIEIVPAGEARDAGFDRGLVLGYGHDDRVCAYSSYKAMLNTPKVTRTACCLLVDKEEIGSVGATGMQSKFFENTVAEIQALLWKESPLAIRKCLANSQMLSSDVDSGFDPNFAECFDSKNVAYLGKGVAFNKFTWYAGKYESNDANAEYIAKIRAVMDDAKVHYQFAELGKVDQGWGGTIAYILSLYGMDVVDCGVPVLNMHAPHEAISKADLYESQKGYCAFLQTK